MSDSQRWMVFGTLLGLGALVYLLQPILMPFLVGALLAYLGDPVADRLEAVGLGRSTAVSSVFAALILAVLAILLLLFPMIQAQFLYLQELLPQIVGWIRDVGLPWLQTRFGLDVGAIRIEDVGAQLAGHWAQTGNIAGMILGRLSSSSLAFVGWIANLALIPVVTFYLLRDWDVLTARIRDLLPRSVEPTVAMLARECDDVLGGFIRGQLMVMLSLGLIYSVGLWLVGLDLALLIGMLAGLASVVPYLGTILGVVAASIAAIFQFQALLPLVLVWIVFGIGQMLEGMLLTPLLVGDRIGMHPVAVIFAILAGGQLFGFVGVLLGLPAAAVIMVLLRHAHDLYKDSDLYHHAGPETAGEDDPPAE